MKSIDIQDILFPAFNDTDEPIVMYRHEDPKPIVIQPGERIVFPKHEQALEEMFDYEILFIGGAGGGGKSRFLHNADFYFHLWLHGKYQEKHGKGKLHKIDTGMFAETRPDLYDRQVTKLALWMPEWAGEWSESKYEFHFYDKWGGGIRKYRGIDRPTRFRSIEFGLAAVDEATLAGPKDSIMNVKSRLRSPILRGICQPIMLMASNPGGVGHSWIKEEFVDEATRVGPSYSEQFKVHRRGYRFIPILPTENPLLDPSWYAELEMQEESIRDAMLYGKWDAYEGMMYPSLNAELHLIPTVKVPDAFPKYIGMDIGGNHPFGALWATLYPANKEHPDGYGVVYREYEAISSDLGLHKQTIHEMGREDKNIQWSVVSHDAFREPLSISTNQTTIEVLNKNDRYGPSLNAIMCDNSRVEGWRAVGRGLSYQGDWSTGKDGFRTLKVKRHPTLYIMDCCTLLWKELKNLQRDKNNPDDAKKKKGTYKVGFGDELPDALRYLWMQMGVYSIAQAEAPKIELHEWDPLRDGDQYLQKKRPSLLARI